MVKIWRRRRFAFHAFLDINHFWRDWSIGIRLTVIHHFRSYAFFRKMPQFFSYCTLKVLWNLKLKKKVMLYYFYFIIWKVRIAGIDCAGWKDLFEDSKKTIRCKWAKFKPPTIMVSFILLGVKSDIRWSLTDYFTWSANVQFYLFTDHL